MSSVLRTLAVAAGLSAAAAAFAADGSRHGDGISLYIGVDTTFAFAAGTYAGLANPNAGRLTLLFDHGDHFHSIGAYSLSGPAAAPTVLNTNANNRLPEIYTRVDAATSAIPLQTGSGAYAGQWVSQVLPTSMPAHEYSYLGLASIQTLPGLSPQADVLYGSSANRWSTSFQGTTVGLQLLNATPGLKVSVNGQSDIFGTSNVFALGSGNTLEFLPTFHVDGSAAAGTYTASFSFVNLSNALNPSVRDSGIFFVDFAVPVPEPETLGLMLAGLAAVGAIAKRRRATAGAA